MVHCARKAEMPQEEIIKNIVEVAAELEKKD